MYLRSLQLLTTVEEGMQALGERHTHTLTFTDPENYCIIQYVFLGAIT